MTNPFIARKKAALSYVFSSVLYGGFLADGCGHHLAGRVEQLPSSDEWARLWFLKILPSSPGGIIWGWLTRQRILPHSWYWKKKDLYYVLFERLPLTLNHMRQVKGKVYFNQHPMVPTFLERHLPLPGRFIQSENWLSARCSISAITLELVFPSWCKPLLTRKGRIVSSYWVQIYSFNEVFISSLCQFPKSIQQNMP